MITLDSSITAVLGKSPKRDKIMNNLHLATVGDLLRHFPRRYLETGKLTEVNELEVGQMLTVIGEIGHSKQHTYTDRRTGRAAYRLETVLLTDGPALRMTFFAQKKHTADWQRRRLPTGVRGLFLGKAETFNAEWKLTNPRMVLFGAPDDVDGADPRSDIAAVEAIAALYPIYPLTAKVESWDFQRAITFARSVIEDPPELIPEAVRREFDLLDIRRAYDQIHAPDERGQVHDAQRYFRFEEALVTQLVLGRRRRAVRALGAVARDGGSGGEGSLLEAFDRRLPFSLTSGQRSIGADIDADLARPHPMNRLLQGEVGSGKTLIALRAMLRVVDSGGQAALLAPTEVLAQQHHRAIRALMGDLASGGMLGGASQGTTVELLTGSMTKTQRTAPLSRLASGESGIAIGTHALLEDQVQFADLGLVVVDEQHRFGVEQRAALTDKAAGSPPHVLVMTATPIPRTVAMTVFGDLETSTLTELPAGRAPIQTSVVNLLDHPGWITRVWERVREEVGNGHQAYVVCPRISGDELEQGEHDQLDLDDDGELITTSDRTATPPALAAVEDGVVALAAGPLAGLRLAAMHGRMPAEAKDATMRAFAAGDIDVLVSTTVIEVGVDVANATIMVLLDADRFGVSQLHQLRGRVGRGGLPGWCLLVSSVDIESPARERLDAVARTTDGFELSRVDLAQRREGDVLGRSQAGRRSGLRHLEVLRDETTIIEARAGAEALLDADPDLNTAPLLAQAVADLEASSHGDFIEKS